MRLTKELQVERDGRIMHAWKVEGKSTKQITEDFNLSRSCIQAIIRKNNYKTTPPPRKMTIGDDYAKYLRAKLK